MEILYLLEKLINFKSVSPKGIDAIEYIAEILTDAGFNCDIRTFGQGKDEVANLYAIHGNSSPNICFAGHVDVVSPIDEELWNSDPFKMTIKNDRVYGRGTVDMKGAIACSMAAVLKFLGDKPDPDGAISFLITTDEEGKAINGTKKMLEHIKDFKPKIDFCILGEPTSMNHIGDVMKIGRRGSINFDLKIKGKAGHVAYPEKAVNPAPIASKIADALSSRQIDNGSEFFQPSNLEITSIDTRNRTVNVIPESVDIKFNIRFNDKHNSDSLVRKVEDIITKYTDNYDLNFSCSSQYFIQEFSPRMQAFAEIIADITKIKPSIETGGGTSDARFIHHFTDVVEFGLDCNLAHKINEYTKISDLQILHDVYYNYLVKAL